MPVLQGPPQAVPGAARELVQVLRRVRGRGSVQGGGGGAAPGRGGRQAAAARRRRAHHQHELKATFERYKQEHGKAFDEVLEERRRSSDQPAAMLKTAVWCLASPEKHFAEVIRSSILGFGTDEDLLTRAIVSRAEVDMKKVREEYTAMYSKTVTDDVTGDTSGYYKDILLTLVGPE